VLERHVTSLQVIHPKVQHSLFKGEPVYRRANVHTVKAEAGWLREGREVIHGAEPMKWGKVRAMTKQRQRELEAEKERTGEEVRQPLYSQVQTRLVRPPRIKNVG
jgi:xeroderma pigmentosum group C-complementing protein